MNNVDLRALAELYYCNKLKLCEYTTNASYVTQHSNAEHAIKVMPKLLHNLAQNKESPLNDRQGRQLSIRPYSNGAQKRSNNHEMPTLTSI